MLGAGLGVRRFFGARDEHLVVAAALDSFVVRLTGKVASITQLNDTLETVIVERSRALTRTQTLLVTALDAMDAAVSVYAEEGTLFEWNEKLDNFQRLIVLKAFRPEKLLFAF